MKRLLLFFCSIAYLAAFTSCETNVIDGVQYIQGPGDCIECSASWNNEIVSLTGYSTISFKSQINGNLEFEYYNNAWWDNGEPWNISGFVVYANDNKIGEYSSASRNGLFTQISIQSIKRGCVIEIVYVGERTGGEYCTSLLKNIKITSKQSNNESNNSNPDWEF
ncbi:MAG: hypothetical protein J6S09_07975 [Paludibacteraceae bacterium]|nr:hypothetical protein [Paludibacteraceae bacterium]